MSRQQVDQQIVRQNRQAQEYDPYQACEADSCLHDLTRAVTLDELLRSDGPHGPDSRWLALFFTPLI
jgi:hypothetical protein